MIPELMNSLASQHARATATFSKLQGATEHLRDMQQTIAPLLELGSSVNRNEVMESIMGLVERGRLSSREAAVALGEMPPQGPALQEWLQAHYQRYGQLVAQASAMGEASREAMTHSALHLMAHAQVLGTMQAPQAQPQAAPPNALVQAQPQPQSGGLANG